MRARASFVRKTTAFNYLSPWLLLLLLLMLVLFLFTFSAQAGFLDIHVVVGICTMTFSQ